MRFVLAAIALIGCAHGGAATTDSGSGSGSGGRDSGGGGTDSSMMIDAPVPIDAAIDANTCATQPCDIPTQCGCTGGQACDINFQTLMGTACRAVTTPGMDTSTCASGTDCAASYVCVGDGTNDACEQYCTSDAQCGTPRGRCVVQLTDGNNNPIPGAVVCSSNCDPSLVSNPTTCPSGWSCDLFTATYMGAMDDIVDCRKAGTATQNAACSATVACAAGYSCVNNGSSNVCARICKPPSNTGCTGGTTCLSFQTPFVVGGTEYGVCL